MKRWYLESVRLNSEIDPDSYLHDLPVIRNLKMLNELNLRGDLIFFVGENGTGKSTLLEAIAIASGFNPEGGTKNFNFSTNKTHSALSDYLTISKFLSPKDGFFLRAESFYNVATEIERLNEIAPMDCYGKKSLHEQSHGESFLSLIQNRFSGHGLYILDEPEAALSPSRLLTLMVEIQDLILKQSQFIIATHSPILLTFPNAIIYELKDDCIQQVSYQETEHYQLTKNFLDCPERTLKYLLDTKNDTTL